LGAVGGWKGTKPLLKVYDWQIRTLFSKLKLLDMENDKVLRNELAMLLESMGSTLFFSAMALVNTTGASQLMILLYDSIKYLNDRDIGVNFEFSKSVDVESGRHGLPFRIFFETEDMLIEGSTVSFY
jgi:hypothetical protein